MSQCTRWYSRQELTAPTRPQDERSHVQIDVTDFGTFHPPSIDIRPVVQIIRGRRNGRDKRNGKLDLRGWKKDSSEFQWLSSHLATSAYKGSRQQK